MENTESRPKMVSYLVYMQRGETMFYIMNGKEVVIGRHPNANILIRSSNVSRFHAIFKLEEFWVVKDNKSLNGVYLNGRKLPPDEWNRLKSGDTVYLGHPTEMDYNFEFVQQQDSPILPRPTKIPKPEEPLKENEKLELQQQLKEQLNEKLEREQRLQEQLKENEKLERELQKLQEQLREKEKVEQELQEKLKDQELQSIREREYLLQERESGEWKLRSNLEAMLEAKEKMLREALEKEHKQNVDCKAHQVKQELVEIQRLRKKAKADVLGHFGDLLETEFTCAICSELFYEAVTLACAHTFCKLCITMWKKKKKECPICRSKVKGGSDTRSLAIDNFIEGMVVHLDPQVAQRRQEVIRERSAGGSFNKQQQAAVGQSGARNISVLLQPRSNSTGQTSLVVARILAPNIGPRQNGTIVLAQPSIEPSTSAIVISDTEDDESMETGSSYYGGYGRCYNCHRQGHWAPSCPFTNS